MINSSTLEKRIQGITQLVSFFTNEHSGYYRNDRRRKRELEDEERMERREGSEPSDHSTNTSENAESYFTDMSITVLAAYEVTNTIFYVLCERYQLLSCLFGDRCHQEILRRSIEVVKRLCLLYGAAVKEEDETENGPKGNYVEEDTKEIVSVITYIDKISFRKDTLGEKSMEKEKNEENMEEDAKPCICSEMNVFMPSEQCRVGGLGHSGVNLLWGVARGKHESQEAV
jgi:hypothetical protein